MPHTGRNPPNSGESLGEMSVNQYRGILQLTTGEKRLLYQRRPLRAKGTHPVNKHKSCQTVAFFTEKHIHPIRLIISTGYKCFSAREFQGNRLMVSAERHHHLTIFRKPGGFRLTKCQSGARMSAANSSATPRICRHRVMSGSWENPPASGFRGVISQENNSRKYPVNLSKNPVNLSNFIELSRSSGGASHFPSCPGFRYRVDIISVDSFLELIPA